MKPTEEQQSILSTPVSPGNALKMVAYAGTGKTSTLCLLAERYNPLDVLYLAFNKSVASDAEMRFPLNTTCKTGHALAYKHVGYRYKTTLGNLQSWQLAKTYRIPLYEAALMLRTLESYLNSADEHILPAHVEPDVLSKFSPSLYTEGMIDKCNILFDDMKESRLGLPMTHSGYVKLFGLSHTNLGVPIILLDEAQDTNPVMLRIVLDQMEAGSRVYLVGDPYQQIYSWRGALNAMSQVDAPSIRLTQSFRFGDTIAGFASKLLSVFFSEDHPLRGLSTIPSALSQVPAAGHTILCRTNAGVVNAAFHYAQAKTPFCVVGEADFRRVLDQLEQIYFLYADKRNLISDWKIKQHPTFGALVQHATESLDDELKARISVIEEHQSNFPCVLRLIRQFLTNERDSPAFRISTAHKAKGLEWDNVLLWDDFPDITFFDEGEKRTVPKKTSLDPLDVDEIHPEEINLLYVASTRAKRVLQPTLNLSSFARMGETQQTTK